MADERSDGRVGVDLQGRRRRGRLEVQLGELCNAISRLHFMNTRCVPAGDGFSLMSGWTPSIASQCAGKTRQRCGVQGAQGTHRYS